MKEIPMHKLQINLSGDEKLVQAKSESSDKLKLINLKSNGTWSQYLV